MLVSFLFQSITPVIAAIKSQAVTPSQTKHAAECISLLLQSGASAKIPRSAELRKAMVWLPLETVRLLHAAGADEQALPDRHKASASDNAGQEMLPVSGGINLQDITRKTIRNHLTQLHQENLFITIPKVPLPKCIQSFLLYDIDGMLDKKWKVCLSRAVVK